VVCNIMFLLFVKVFITFCILSSPDYELYDICADSQPKSVGLVWGLAATRHSVCIHEMNRMNSRSDHGHEDSTINIVIELLIIIIIIHIFCVLWHFSGYCVFCSQCQCNWMPGKTHLWNKLSFISVDVTSFQRVLFYIVHCITNK